MCELRMPTGDPDSHALFYLLRATYAQADSHIPSSDLWSDGEDLLKQFVDPRDQEHGVVHPPEWLRIHHEAQKVTDERLELKLKQVEGDLTEKMRNEKLGTDSGFRSRPAQAVGDGLLHYG